MVKRRIRPWRNTPEIQSCGFERPIEDWKDNCLIRLTRVSNICAGIAQTGTLLLWPDAQQPRSMSLVPPIHIALFDTTTLHDDFSARCSLRLAHNTPNNLVLISSPSKTSDIQLTLAFGAPDTARFGGAGAIARAYCAGRRGRKPHENADDSFSPQSAPQKRNLQSQRLRRTGRCAAAQKVCERRWTA